MTALRLLSEHEVHDKLKLLNVNLHRKWQASNNKLFKEFVFDDFQSAFGFMSRCSLIIEKINHHPEWCNNYNKVSVHLTTHDTGGITCCDFELAALMEEAVVDI